VIGYSPYGSASLVYLINYVNPTPATDDSGLLWLWILLGILGAIILVGVVFFIIKRRKNKSIDYGKEPLTEDAWDDMSQPKKNWID